MVLTRQAIITKMNYVSGDSEYEDGFKAGLRDILGTALTRPLNTDWYQFFNEKRVFDYRWYFRCDRRALAETCVPDIRRGCLAAVERIETDYPGIEEEPMSDRIWGDLAGRHAAIRWLGEEDRQCAEDWFPFLDT